MNRPRIEPATPGYKADALPNEPLCQSLQMQKLLTFFQQKYTVEPRYLELAYFELPLSRSENLVPVLTWNYDNR